MPRGKLRTQVVKKAEALAIDPCPAGYKKLKGIKEGDEPVWRVRSGDYRILYVRERSDCIGHWT